MQLLNSPSGTRISYDKRGSGPALVLIHGSFSDHRTNWEFVQPLLQRQFTIYAIARRGRGSTDATDGHSIEDEANDAVALIESIDEPVLLLGHSYGAHVALAAAAKAPERVRKLVLYEAPWPTILMNGAAAQLEVLAQMEDWDALAMTFFHQVLKVPLAELEALRATELWPPILTDAKASLRDLRALRRYDFNVERFIEVRMPVMLQVGSQSPRHFYVTDALAAALPNARIHELRGQAHEGMTTAPEMYAEAISPFLLS